MVTVIFNAGSIPDSPFPWTALLLQISSDVFQKQRGVRHSLSCS